MKKRILCFGDSNTWGYDPKDGSRYVSDIRWTGRLQILCGNGFEIIEEGLNGRTSAFSYKNRNGKNGLEYLRPCLDSHFPLNAVILCLGPNDSKVEFNLSVEQIGQGIEECIRAIFGEGLERPSPNLKVILAAPVLVDERYINGYLELRGAEAKTKALPKIYRELADKHGAIFVDLSKQVSPSEVDGCHLDPDGHAKIAQIYYELLRGLAI